MESKDSLRQSRPPSRSTVKYGMVYSKFSRWKYGEGFRVDPSWYEWYKANVRCKHCRFPRRQWQEHPQPLSPTLVGAFEGTSGGALHCPAAFYRADLKDALAEYIREAVWGQCALADDGTMRSIPYHSLQVPRADQVYAFRGAKYYADQPDAGHFTCPGCGRLQGFGGISEAFVESDIKERPVVVDAQGTVYVRKEFALQLKLKERFPDLRLYMTPVLKEPADGWTLPNDPGWDGTLRPPEGFGKIPPFPCLRPGD